MPRGASGLLSGEPTRELIIKQSEWKFKPPARDSVREYGVGGSGGCLGREIELGNGCLGCDLADNDGSGDRGDDRKDGCDIEAPLPELHGTSKGFLQARGTDFFCFGGFGGFVFHGAPRHSGWVRDPDP